MQVSFSGILKAYIPSETPLHTNISNKTLNMNAFENVLNNREETSYDDREKKKIVSLAQKNIWDYKFPKKGENDPEAGIYRIKARDAIYYCTGSDIEAAKEKKAELDKTGLSSDEKKDKMQEFVEERTNGDNSGFVMLNSQDGKRYDILGMGEYKSDVSFYNKYKCDFLYL